jgi:hypothetical protein
LTSISRASGLVAICGKVEAAVSVQPTGLDPHTKNHVLALNTDLKNFCSRQVDILQQWLGCVVEHGARLGGGAARAAVAADRQGHHEALHCIGALILQLPADKHLEEELRRWQVDAVAGYHWERVDDNDAASRLWRCVGMV